VSKRQFIIYGNSFVILDVYPNGVTLCN